MNQRIIKFRAWDKENKIMAYDNDILIYGVHSLNFAINKWQQDYELMQFTGLMDKDGKEIYEGDFYKNVKGGIKIIKYENFGFEFDDEGIGFDILHDVKEKKAYGEVIGNIYENKELLT